MNEVVEFDKTARVRTEAGVWVVRLQEGLSDAQKKELATWLNIDSMHHAQFLELATLWDELEVLTELAPLFNGVTHGTERASSASENATPARPSWLNAPLAAGCVLACCVGLFLINSIFDTSNESQPSKLSSKDSTTALSAPIAKTQLEQSPPRYHRTPIGEQLKVELSDGSKATLNTDTHIEIAFTDRKRTINLLRGEVHFSVFKDPTRPLIVMVSGKSVEAVGTSFSVRKKPHTAIEVAVDEGRVAVYPRQSTEASDVDEKNHPVSLNAGEVLTIAGDQQQLAHYDLDEMANRLAWREGMIIINSETLDYVIQEFERYNTKKVLLANRAMGDIRVAGYFRLGDVDALLVALENNFNIRSEFYHDKQTYVLSEL